MHKWPKKKRRFHKDTYPGNRWNRGDFILWYGYKEGDNVYWDTEIGKGRPAWNIQDPAMLTQHLGFKADICCGGIDNIIRHHDYVIAVIEGITKENVASCWLHAGHLYIDGKKMSKSLGNIIYPQDLLKKGYQWVHIRFFLIYGHYRQRLNFTLEKFDKVCKRLDTFKQMVKNLSSYENYAKKPDVKTRKAIDRLMDDFVKNMNNDLHVKEAFDTLFNNVSKLVKNKHKISVEDSNKATAKLKGIYKVLQVL